MASPKIETFFVLNATTGLPATGLTPTFSTYKDDTGVNVTAPAISEIGGGLYKFTPVFADPNKALAYVISTGQNPAYVWGLLRPEQWNADGVPTIATNVTTLVEFANADEELVTTGGDAGRIVARSGSDHATVLAKWDALKADGVTKDTTGNLTFHRKKV